MTLKALHIAGASFTTATLAVVVVLWVLAEQRRAAAERRVDELRAQTIAVLLRVDGLIGMTDDHLSAWCDETPQAWTLDPRQERIRLAHSAAWAARNLTSGTIAAFEGNNHGR